MYSLWANVELLLMCVLFVGMMFCFNLRYWRPRVLNPLSCIYLLTVIGCFLEMGAFFVDGKPELIWLNYLFNILYLGSIGLIGACLMAYCSEQFPQPVWKNRLSHFLWMLPALAELVMLVSAPKTGLIFYIDAQGFYHRGDTFFLQFIPYGYLFCSTIYGIRWFIKSETTKERNQYLAISLFAIPPFFLGGIQLFVSANSLDILEFSVALSLLANFAISQNNRITRDPLTRLANRGQLDALLHEKIRNRRKDDFEQLFVLMGDLDGFKRINDTHGHLEGDRALILTADVLYQISNSYRGTAARFGGDEFVIVVEAISDAVPEKMAKEINERLAQVSCDEKFKLQMSIGYAVARPSDTVPELLRAADRELYRIKNEKHLTGQR